MPLPPEWVFSPKKKIIEMTKLWNRLNNFCFFPSFLLFLSFSLLSPLFYFLFESLGGGGRHWVGGEILYICIAALANVKTRTKIILWFDKVCSWFFSLGIHFFFSFLPCRITINSAFFASCSSSFVFTFCGCRLIKSTMRKVSQSKLW